MANPNLTDARFYSSERIALFIDGNSIFSAIKGLNKKINYKRVNSLFAKQGKLVASFYYTPLREEDEFIALQPLIDFLSYNGYRVRTKSFFEDKRPSMNVDITCDMLEQSPNIDHYVLFSGDGDFARVIDVLQSKGKRVTVISNKEQLADSIHRACDFFVPIEALGEIFEDAPPQNSKLYDD